MGLHVQRPALVMRCRYFCHSYNAAASPCTYLYTLLPPSTCFTLFYIHPRSAHPEITHSANISFAKYLAIYQHPLTMTPWCGTTLIVCVSHTVLTPFSGCSSCPQGGSCDCSSCGCSSCGVSLSSLTPGISLPSRKQPCLHSRFRTLILTVVQH